MPSGALLGCALGVLWLSHYECLRGELVSIYGDDPPSADTGGAPLWRCALALPTQLLVLPGLFGFGWASNGWSMGEWRRRWDAAEVDWNAAESAYFCVFGGFMLVDFCICSVRPVMALHHVVCLLGHVTGVILDPLGMPDYFAGVVALEMGSAACNLYWLYPQSRLASLIYLLGMPLSNLLALYSATQWAFAVSERRRGGGEVARGMLSRRVALVLPGGAEVTWRHLVGYALTGGLSLMRQKTAIRILSREDQGGPLVDQSHSSAVAYT